MAQESRLKELAASLAAYGGDKTQIIEECASYGNIAVPFLLKVLKTTESGDVAKTLGKIRDSSAVEPLIRSFEEKSNESSTDGLVGSAAATALGDIGDPRAIEPLLKALRTKNSAKYDFGAVAMALGELGVAEALPLLEELVANAGNRLYEPFVTRHVGKEARKAIQKIQKKILPEDDYLIFRQLELLEQLDSKDVDKRKDACYESVEVGGKDIVVALINTLERYPDPQYNEPEDVYQGTTKAAAYALGKLADPSSNSALLRAIAKDYVIGFQHMGGGDIRFVKASEGSRDIDMGVFGTNIREGLEEADTEFSRDIIMQAEQQGLIQHSASERETSTRQDSAFNSSATRSKKWWQFWK